MKAPSLRFVLLLVLLLVVTAGVYWYFSSYRSASDPPVPTAKRRAKPKAPSGLTEPVTMKKIRAWYALKPDQRFLTAFSEVDRFLGIKDAQPAKASFRDDHWILELPEMPATRLSLYPDFPEWAELLSRYTDARIQKQNFSIPEGVQTDDLAERFRYASPLKFLRDIDEAWKKEPSSYLLCQAAKAMALLSFQLSDRAGIGTSIHARSLAYLALAKSITRSPQEEAEALLSHALSYTEHAKQQVRTLPAENPVRLYILRNDSDLRNIATASNSARLTRYLYIQRQSTLKKGDDWLDHARELFPDFELPLPLMKTAMDSGDFELRRYFGSGMSDQALAELSALTGIRSDLKDLTAGNKIDLLDSLILSIKSDGWFLEAPLIASFYSTYFYSGLAAEGLFYLDTLSSIDASSEFAAELGSPKSVMGKEFAQWYQHLAAVKAGKQKWNILFKDLVEMRHLGAGLHRRTMGELSDTIPYKMPETIQSVKRYAALLDARPEHRIWLADKMYRELADSQAPEPLYSSYVQCCKDRNPANLVWYSKFTGHVQELLDWKDLDESGKTDVFYYMTKSKDLSSDQVTQAYRKLYVQYPRSLSLARNYASYLDRNNKSREAEDVLRDWINDHSYEREGLKYVSTCVQLAGILRRQERYEEAFRVIAPVVSSWQAGALIEAARLLDKLEKKKEAREMARKALDRYPDAAGAMSVNLQLLWEAGEYKKAAETLKNHSHRFSANDWCYTFGRQYAEVFIDKPDQEGIEALSELYRLKERGPVECVAKRVYEKGDIDLTFGILEFSHRSRQDPEDLVEAYKFLGEGKYKSQVQEWLRQLPENKFDIFGALAFKEEAYELLWDPVTPNPKLKFPEIIWLMRAASSAKIGSQDPHRKELIDHYTSEKPDLVKFYNSGPQRRLYRKLGQYLLDLIPAEKVLESVDSNFLICESAYYLGQKSETLGDYESASRWYRMAVETQSQHICSSWSLDILHGWHSTGRNLEYIARQKIDASSEVPDPL